jgi:signal transduction histidine kinase
MLHSMFDVRCSAFDVPLMKLFKSIKWRLQIWYGLILVVVLAGFGFTAYQLERGRMLRKVDNDLNMRLHLITEAFHLPPHRPGFGPPPDRPPEGPGVGTDQENRPPPPPDQFHLSAWAEHFFGTNDGQNFYYVVWSRYGDQIAQGGDVPTHKIAWKAPEPVGVGTVDDFREIQSRFPLGEGITVGRSLAPELKDLRLIALRLAAVGAAILLFGLAGGWWLVGRALRPIADISATAVKISAGDLSQRINVAEAESELGQLASVLNSTFARLEAAFAQQQQFTSDAAHELRTPVSVMLTQTQATLNRERSATEYRATVEACHRAAQRIRRLIESLLELARLDAGQEQMKRMPFDLSQTARDCVVSVRPLADGRGVKIHCELPPLKCTGDSERLAQVITNLLTNAIQYNREGGEVRLAAQSQNGAVTLAVSDTGRGIPAEDLPHIFERFYRGDKSRSSGNTGLGLAISKAIVEAHGGTIEVSSNPDVGTTFTVRLPT